MMMKDLALERLLERFKALSLAEVQMIADDYGYPTKGRSKRELIDRILNIHSGLDDVVQAYQGDAVTPEEALAMQVIVNINEGTLDAWLKEIAVACIERKKSIEG